MESFSITIITINYNNATGLLKTIDSLAHQNNKSFEYIIIDGGSTDGSLLVIKNNIDLIDYYISEPDKGVYHAMNKGLAKATGEYCLFLNSGDILFNQDTISNLHTYINSNCDIYFSDCAIGTSKDYTYINYPQNITTDYLLVNTINHQNQLIRLSLLEKCGGYREDMMIRSDWLLTLQAATQFNAKFQKITEPISIYDNEGISSRPEMITKANLETIRGIKALFPIFSDTLVEYIKARQSIFGNIVYNFGYSKFLHFSLRTYRFLARKIPFLRNNRKRTFSEMQELQ